MTRTLTFMLVVAMSLAAAACDDASSTPSPPATTDPAATAPPTAGDPTPEARAPTSTPDETGISRNPITPMFAAEGGRADCPVGWLVHTDAAFTVCYPPDYYAHTWSSAAFASRLSLRLIPGEPVAYTPNGLTVWFTSSYEGLDECVFQEEAVVPDADTQLIAYEIAGTEGVACLAEASYATQFNGAVPLPDGALNFWTQASDDAMLNLAMNVLETVQAR